VAFGNRASSSGWMESSQAASMIASWVSTAYALAHCAAHSENSRARTYFIRYHSIPRRDGLTRAIITVVHWRTIALAGLTVLLVLGLACRSQRDSPLASAIPPDAALVGSLDPPALRRSPAYRELPPAVLALLDSYPSASRLALAWSPNTVLTLAEGAFEQPPPGAVLAGPRLAISGSEGAVGAAAARFRAHAKAASPILDYAARWFPDAAAWIVARGNIVLPVSGNAANLNRLLRDLDYAGIGLHLNEPARLNLHATGATAEAARRFEESLRAFLSLVAMGEARHPGTASLLESARIERSGREVRLVLTAPADRIVGLLTAIAR